MLPLIKELSRFKQMNHTYLVCQCFCGNKFIARQDTISRGITKSCGCYRRKYMSETRTGISPSTKTHGESAQRSAEYRAWSHIKTRCTNPNTKDWKDYGGRGITMCQQWLNSYETFLADVGRRPSPEYSIDRINVDGNYEPGNVRWATATQQANNKRKYKSLFNLN